MDDRGIWKISHLSDILKSSLYVSERIIQLFIVEHFLNIVLSSLFLPFSSIYCQRMINCNKKNNCNEMETVLPHDSAVHWSQIRSSSFTFLFFLSYYILLILSISEQSWWDVCIRLRFIAARAACQRPHLCPVSFLLLKVRSSPLCLIVTLTTGYRHYTSDVLVT